jgi:hypothetical protein
MGKRKKNYRKQFEPRSPRFIIVNGKKTLRLKTFAGVRKIHADEVDDISRERPTREQQQAMRELGFRSLAEAQDFAWRRLPMNCSAFRALFINLKKILD